MDFSKAGMLLHVVEKSRDYPKLAFLTAAAMRELEAMEPKAAPAPEPQPELDLTDRGHRGPATPNQIGDGPKVFPADGGRR